MPVDERPHPEQLSPFAEQPHVQRLGPAELTIHWRGAATKVVDVLASNAPTSPANAEKIGELTSGNLHLEGFSAQERSYFFLRPADASPPRWVAERRIPLEGAPNLRDLGGYPTTEGRHLRWGQLFRTGSLHGLGAADQQLLASLGIRTVCDFRTPLERQREPHAFPAAAHPEQIAVSHEQLEGALQPDDMRERIATGNFDDLAIDSLLVDGNDSFATTHRAPFQRMIHIACDSEDYPFLVNCSAGKDRAGFATAVLLLTLGVSRQTIRHDYLLTSYYTAADASKKLEMIRQQVPPEIDVDALRPLFEARSAYINAAFAAIDRVWGSDTNFLQQGLELRSEQMDRLRDRLLE